LRLVWVPAISPGAHESLGEKIWERVDPATLDEIKSAEFNIVMRKVEAQLNLHDRTDLLDTDEANAEWDVVSNNVTTLGDSPLSEFEKSIPMVWKNAQAKSVASKEKAFSLAETLVIDTTITSATSVAQMTGISVLSTTRKTSRRPVYVFPLVSVESTMGPPLIKHANRISDNSVKIGQPLWKLRQDLIKSSDYKFLFEYVFPLPRMLSLITIYNGNSLSLSQPDVDHALNKTKGELRSLFYSLSPDEKENWWERRDEALAANGGNAGVSQIQNQSLSTKGPSVDLIKMAMMTVPIMVRGMAEYMDPHYSLVSRLVDAGWGGGKNWGKVFPLWPVNFFFGWGPPLTPIGMAAYSMPALPGDKKKEKQAALGKKLDDATASSDPGGAVDEECED